jgi:hypothetical protein
MYISNRIKFKNIKYVFTNAIFISWSKNTASLEEFPTMEKDLEEPLERVPLRESRHNSDISRGQSLTGKKSTNKK